MAVFHSAKREFGIQPFQTEGNIVLMNRTGTVRAGLARAQVQLSIGTTVRKYTSQRSVIEGPDGAQILPYFKTDSGWKVVMVELFRIALPGQTLEAAGGEIDENEKDPRLTMARELKEETGIEVHHDDIRIVLEELTQPSIMAATAFGGIVEILESQIPSNLVHGEWDTGEYTVVVIKPLLELLRFRDSMPEARFDLWASRLLDEVAKKVGVLVKNY